MSCGVNISIPGYVSLAQLPVLTDVDETRSIPNNNTFNSQLSIVLYSKTFIIGGIIVDVIQKI